jgi:hypothetical protein
MNSKTYYMNGSHSKYCEKGRYFFQKGYKRVTKVSTKKNSLKNHDPWGPSPKVLFIQKETSYQLPSEKYTHCLPSGSDPWVPQESSHGFQ